LLAQAFTYLLLHPTNGDIGFKWDGCCILQMGV